MTTTVENPTITIENGLAIEKRDKKAQKIIRKYVLIASAGGLVSMPLVSVGATVTTQVLMIRDLCSLYHVPFDEKMTTLIINSSIGGVLTKAISMAISTVIPGSQPTVGIDVSGAVICGLYTATVGEFYKVHFDNNGNLEDASIRDLAKYFMEEIERGDIGLDNFTNPFKTMTNLLKTG